MIRSLALLVPLVAACGGTQAGPAPTPVSNTTPVAPAAYPAPLYAGLFEDGATYRYKIHASSEYYDPQDPRANAHGAVIETSDGAMSCTVGEVEALPDAIVSVVTCDGDLGVPVGGGDPDGTYVATRDGLWRVGSVADAKAGRLVADDMLVPWPPVAHHSDDDGMYVTFDPDGRGGWCLSRSWSEGDDGSTTLCFANGAIDSGSGMWAGGSTREATFERVP